MAGEDGAPAAVLAHFLDARIPASLIDERLLWALRRLPGEGGLPPGSGDGRGPARSNLARWFPRAPTPVLAETLVGLLSDPDALVRFWALAHLKDLAGTDHGYDEKAVDAPPAPEVLERWRSWAQGFKSLPNRLPSAGPPGPP